MTEVAIERSSSDVVPSNGDERLVTRCRARQAGATEPRSRLPAHLNHIAGATAKQISSLCLAHSYNLHH